MLLCLQDIKGQHIMNNTLRDGVHFSRLNLRACADKNGAEKGANLLVSPPNCDDNVLTLSVDN